VPNGKSLDDSRGKRVRPCLSADDSTIPLKREIDFQIRERLRPICAFACPSPPDLGLGVAESGLGQFGRHRTWIRRVFPESRCRPQDALKLEGKPNVQSVGEKDKEFVLAELPPEILIQPESKFGGLVLEFIG
jgi:hypothetical protein